MILRKKKGNMINQRLTKRIIWRIEMEEITFEDALVRLEEVVNNLEEGNLSLDESLGKFEEGILLSRMCNKRLKEAKQKVEKLVEKNGKFEKEPMEI
jgi:exodeoxyribonuclease VII small subunit